MKQPKCPKCGSKEIRFRLRTNDYWCRRCGQVFKQKEGREGMKNKMLRLTTGDWVYRGKLIERNPNGKPLKWRAGSDGRNCPTLQQARDHIDEMYAKGLEV